MWKPTEKQKKAIKAAEKAGKEFFYVGHYFDVFGHYILKIGTTDNLRRRRTEHNQNYRKSKTHPMKPGTEFEYDWFLPLSKYNTVRIEDRTRTALRDKYGENFVRNDRFVFPVKPAEIRITVRKTYTVAL